MKTGRQTSAEAVDGLFAALAAQDVDGALSYLHDSFVFELPFEEGAPPKDKAGFGRLLTRLRGQFGRFDIGIVDRVESADGTRIAARYAGDALSRGGAISYRNTYVGFFDFRDGLIVALQEYPNPLITQKLTRDLVAAAQAGMGPAARSDD